MATSQQNIFFVHTCLILRKQTWWKLDLYTCEPLLTHIAHTHAYVFKAVFTLPVLSKSSVHTKCCCSQIHFLTQCENYRFWDHFLLSFSFIRVRGSTFSVSFRCILFTIVDELVHWGTQSVADPGNVLVFILIWWGVSREWRGGEWGWGWGWWVGMGMVSGGWGGDKIKSVLFQVLLLALLRLLLKGGSVFFFLLSGKKNKLWLHHCLFFFVCVFFCVK